MTDLLSPENCIKPENLSQCFNVRISVTSPLVNEGTFVHKHGDRTICSKSNRYAFSISTILARVSFNIVVHYFKCIRQCMFGTNTATKQCHLRTRGHSTTFIHVCNFHYQFAEVYGL